MPVVRRLITLKSSADSSTQEYVKIVTVWIQKDACTCSHQADQGGALMMSGCGRCWRQSGGSCGWTPTASPAPRLAAQTARSTPRRPPWPRASCRPCWIVACRWPPSASSPPTDRRRAPPPPPPPDPADHRPAATDAPGVASKETCNEVWPAHARRWRWCSGRR